MSHSKYIIDLKSRYSKVRGDKLELNLFDIDLLIDEMIARKEEIDAQVHFWKIFNETLVVIDYGNIIDLDTLSIGSQRKLIAKFIKTVFSRSEIYTTDKIRVSTSHTGLRKLTNSVEKNYFNILLFSDSLVQTATYKGSAKDTKGRCMEYRYYDAYLSLDGKNVFSMQLNIRIDHMGATLYDINKIKKSGWTVRLGKPGTL